MKNLNIALSAIIVCSFAALSLTGCGSGGGDVPYIPIYPNIPNNNDAIIPTEYQNKKWYHAEGATLELTTDKVIITLSGGSQTTYPFSKVDTISGNTVLHFNTNNNVEGLVSIKNGQIIGIVFPVLTKSGGWSDNNNNNNNNNNTDDGTKSGTFTSINDAFAWLLIKPANDKEHPYAITLNINSLDYDILYYEEFFSWYDDSHDNPLYFSIDLSESYIDSHYYNSYFYSRKGLISITFPDDASHLNLNLFKNCTNLTAINIRPRSNVDYDYDPYGINEQYSINGLLYWYDGMRINLQYCPKGKTGSLSIPQGTEGIYNINDCTGLTNITIPNSVTSIYYETFKNCTSLTSVTLGNGVKYILGNAFENCTSLTSITLPSSVWEIGSYAFFGCTSLTTVICATGSNIAGDISNPTYIFKDNAFPEGINGEGGNTLRDAYFSAKVKAGTYTRATGGSTWTKSL